MHFLLFSVRATPLSRENQIRLLCVYVKSGSAGGGGGFQRRPPRALFFKWLMRFAPTVSQLQSWFHPHPVTTNRSSSSSDKSNAKELIFFKYQGLTSAISYKGQFQLLLKCVYLSIVHMAPLERQFVQFSSIEGKKTFETSNVEQLAVWLHGCRSYQGL